jgi:hypothetical protein
MKQFIAPILFWTSAAHSQVYVEPEWLPPLPPPIEASCVDEEKVSEPIIAYRISNTCTLTDVRAVGEYQYGTEQVRSDVLGFSSEQLIRRFVSGSMIHFKEISIQLHRTYERPATLVCTVDMMGKKVIDAKIIRERVLSETRTVKYDEPVTVVENQLADLGVFTYSKPISYKTDSCPD